MVYSATGATMFSSTLTAGESKTVALSPGIYVVNGKKVIIPKKKTDYEQENISIAGDGLPPNGRFFSDAEYKSESVC